MGRPLNKKYFANTNYQDFGTANVGGESVASVTISGSWANFTQATTTVVFSDPQIQGGVTATGTVTVTAGAPASVTITNPGSGYTSAPTVTIADSDGGAETTGTATAVLTSGASARQNGIKCETQYGSGDSEITTGDVIKQVSTKRYKVQTSQGTGTFKLVTTEAKAAGEMSIKATDSDGNTYFVAKLTARKVVLVPAANVHGGTTTIGSQFASGATAKWTFDSAVVNTTVTIENQ
jgi:hypothetical protein